MTEIEWLTGFWEGDGGVQSVSKLGRTGRRYTIPVIIFYQRDAQVLEYIRDFFEFGHLEEHSSSGNWELRFVGKTRCAPVLELFSRHTVCQTSLDKLGRVSERCQLPLTAKLHEPTIPWAVGFWDAEGSLLVPTNDYDLRVTYTQKSREVLERLAGLIGGNVTYDKSPERRGYDGSHKLALYGSNARRLVPEILKYSHCTAKTEKLRTLVSEGHYKMARGT